MKTKNTLFTLITLLFLVFSTTLFASNLNGEQEGNNLPSGMQLAAKCAACHGATGNQPLPGMPKIAGQPIKYFIEQMQYFKQGKEGKRFNPIMYAMATPLSEQQLKTLAEYFATQKITANKSAKSSDPQMKEGSKLYRGGMIARGIPACAACHGPKGKGNHEAGFPSLAGQKADYLLTQLKAYKQGLRKNNIHHMMEIISKKMTLEEMKAISLYASQLQSKP